MATAVTSLTFQQFHASVLLTFRSLVQVPMLRVVPHIDFGSVGYVKEALMLGLVFASIGSKIVCSVLVEV